MSKRITLSETEIKYVLAEIKDRLILARIGSNSRDLITIDVLGALKTKLGGDDE